MIVLDSEQLRWVSGAGPNDSDSDIVVIGDPGDDYDPFPDEPWDPWADDGSFNPPPPGGSAGNSGDYAYLIGLNAVGESHAPYEHKPHMQPGDTRGLTPAEKSIIKNSTTLSDNQINNIRVHAGGQYGADTPATTIRNTINMNTSYALTDFSSDPDTMDLLIHEATHVEQWEELGGIRIGADELLRLMGGDIYSYDLHDLNAILNGTNDFSSLNIEAQSTMASDLYRIQNGLPALGAADFSPTASELSLATGIPRHNY